MNKGERLAQFLEWVRVNGGTALPAGDVRLIAVALLEESGGGRVTESHILDASDRHAGVGGAGAVAKVHEVGELFLAFEESQRQAGAPAPAPKGPMGTMRPRGQPGEMASGVPAGAGNAARVAADPRSSQPIPRARLEDTGEVPTDIARPLPVPRGESAVPVGEVEPPKVTFASRGGAPARKSQPPPVAAGTPVPSSPAGSSPAARGAGSTSAVMAGQTFRCPKCATMVEAAPGGVCPRCGSMAPRKIALPPGSEAAAMAERRTSPILIGGLLVAVVGGGALIARSLMKSDGEAVPGRPIAGAIELPYLSLVATFPKGWNSLDPQLNVPLTEELQARALGFAHARAELVLAVAREIPLPDEALDVLSDEELRQVAGELAEAAPGAAGKPFPVDAAGCEVLAVGLRRTARCPGESGDEQLALYAFALGDRLGVAYLSGTMSREALLGVGDELVAGLEDQSPSAGPGGVDGVIIDADGGTAAEEGDEGEAEEAEAEAEAPE